MEQGKLVGLDVPEQRQEDPPQQQAQSVVVLGRLRRTLSVSVSVEVGEQMAERGGVRERDGMVVGSESLQLGGVGEGVEEGVEELGGRGRGGGGGGGEDAVDDGGDGFGRDGVEAALEGGQRHGPMAAAAAAAAGTRWW